MIVATPSRNPICCPAVVTLFLVVCLQICRCGGAWAGDDIQARARWVADGDTLVLVSGETVRLKGIDAPELGRDGAPDQYYARESREGLAGLVQGLELALELEGESRDRHGRVLAWVRLPDGRLVQEVLLDRGLVFVYPHPGDSLKHHHTLLKAQQRAMDARLGFWDRILDLPVAEKTFMGNRRSMRFHAPGCHNAKRMSRSNRVPFAGLEAAFRKGYAPARCCTPWPPGR